MNRVFVAAIALLFTPAIAQAEMSVSFQWGNIPVCTNGSPNTVANPVFRLRGVPAGTETVEFELVDLNVPRYDHGGARLGITSDLDVPSGTFTYRSPCPPSGAHTYEWRVTARAGRQVLATAAAQRRYPE